MARTFTLLEIRDRAKQRADMVNSSFVSNAEWDGYITAVYSELYDLLVRSGLSYFESTQSITGTGAQAYALPTDYYGTVRVDYLDGNDLVPLKRIETSEIHFFSTTADSESVAYRIVGSNLELFPPPNGGQYRHRYIPVPAKLTMDTDVVDGVSGWEEYLVLGAAIMAGMKEETDTRPLQFERDRMRQRIEEMSHNREWGDPGHVTQSLGTFARDPGDFTRSGIR